MEEVNPLQIDGEWRRRGVEGAFDGMEILWMGADSGGSVEWTV